MKRIYLGTNLKMYKTNRETVTYLKELTEKTAALRCPGLELFVIPSFTALPEAVEAAEGKIKIGAQNMCWEDAGEYTGEISPRMLKTIGIDLIEIGHSERRHKFGETNFDVNRKVLAALRHGFTPLLCIGETEADKAYGVTTECLREQLKIGLYGVTGEQARRVWVAYEPVWAIGVGGKPATPEYANRSQQVIKDTLAELFPDNGGEIPVLYGGSVNSRNATGLIEQPAIDGLFIGRAAWEAESFAAIIKQVLDAGKRNY
ncbi:MAG TPA: triose-phosphate isomerase [Capillibacterium sp.]